MSMDKRLLSKPKKIQLQLKNSNERQRLLKDYEHLKLPPNTDEKLDESDIEM